MTIQKLLHEQYFPLALFTMLVVKMKIMAIFTLETGYPWIIRADRQYVLIRKWNGLNFGWIYPPHFVHLFSVNFDGF